MTSVAMRCGTVALMLALSLVVGRATAQENVNSGHLRPNRPVYPASKPAAAKATQHSTAKPRATPPAKPSTVLVPLPQAPPKAKTKATRAASKATSEATASMPAAERLKIRSALLWSGDYSEASASEDPLIGAIRNYQKRKKEKATGVLTPDQQAALIATAQAHEQEFGWRVVIDPATGIRLGLPLKLVPFAHDAARGTRWSSAHGEIQVETFRIKQAGLKLADLFAQEKKHPVDRTVQSGALNDDGFTLRGTQGLRDYSVRARMRRGEIRGLAIQYDQAMAGIVAPALAPMANAFSPFSERGAPFAALTKPVEYGTGLIVSPRGAIVTASNAADNCQVFVVAGLGNAERVATDRTAGLSLLRVYGRRKLAVLPLADAGRATAGELTLVGIPDPRQGDGRGSVVAVKARPAADGLELSEPVPMAGFSGAGVLDDNGNVLGMMEMRHEMPVGETQATASIRLVAAMAIRDFLKAHNVTPAARGNPRDAVVRVICVKK